MIRLDFIFLLLSRWKFALRNKSEADDLTGGVDQHGASGRREQDGYA